MVVSDLKLTLEMQLNPIGDSPLIIFDPLDEVDDSTTSNGKDQHNAKDKKNNIYIPMLDGKLEIKNCEDQSLAKDYLCKICQFIVIDPREHNVLGTQSYACSSLFCHKCIINWIQSGKTCCPSSGCLTVDLDESSFREVGPRDFARLSDLRVKCPFSCGFTTSYSEYYSVHLTQCPANPANRCKICKSPKIGPNGKHDCRIVFNEMRQKIESLGKKVAKLNVIIGQMRTELEEARQSTNGGQSMKENMDKKEANKDKKDDSKGKNNQPVKGGAQKKKNQQATENNSTCVTTINSAENSKVTNESKQPFITFYSNCYHPSLGATGINLVFHYGPKNYNFDDLQPTYTVRTLRSLLTDMIGHDPGLMLMIRHKVLHDKDIIRYCGFRPGENIISILPNDTPNYAEPGFRLTLYPPRPPSAVKGKGDDGNQSKVLHFYSNSLEPQLGANSVKLTLRADHAVFMINSVKLQDRTISDIRNQATKFFGNNPVKMVYFTHQKLRDDMSVGQCGFKPGTTDITLVPFSYQLKFVAHGALHLTRFHLNKGPGNKSFPKPHRSTSLASLVD